MLTAADLEDGSASPLREFLVVCLCAAWCGTCREFRDAFVRMAAEDTEASYVWLDVEDDSALAGDIDVENFPTLAVFSGNRPVFYGVTLPKYDVVKRTLESLRARDAGPVEVPEPVAALAPALRGA